MRYLLLICLICLAGCGMRQPFGKDEAVTSSPILAPPWEALVAAGPGAANDIDLETLHGPAAQPALSDEEMPEVVTEAEAAPKASPVDPSKTQITAVAVVAVNGAGTKGNQELTAAMRNTLGDAGWKVLSAPAKNALTIAGRVDLGTASGGNQTVALAWAVQTPDGKSLGNVRQSNQVPAGSLDAGWGENAGFATQAAATGIFELINKFR